ncbi:MAG: urease accessory protein UreF [Octadecabacter sp.]
MPTDPHLTLAQWFSPAYPIGAFAYSHGLEWAIDAGDVTDVTTLLGWVTDVLQHGSGHNDALFIAASYHAENPSHVDVTCRAFAPSRERLKETDLQGAAFCDITSQVWGVKISGLTYPVAIGHAARLCDLPLPLTLQMYLQSFASLLVSVGMRLVPLGQTDGHKMIQQLTPLCSEIAKQAQSGDLSELSSTAFLPDIASMKHETQYSKVFRT